MTDFILGVVGHVDHGKTALTYALTGVETDRLKEERQRGLTIESGFASFPLPGGHVAAVIDAPGHNKLVPNMLTCAAGLDAVLLTVAADDGVMPQTREHLNLCTLLGISLGLVVLTKCDQTSDARRTEVTRQIRELTAGTFLEQAPILSTAALTGMGIPELKAAVTALGERIAPRDTNAPFRLYVDRVFTMEGFGTVVTGSILDGKVAVGEVLQIYPSGETARVRSLQSHGAEARELSAGRRAAVNLAGISREEVQRGDTLAAPGSMVLTKYVETTMTLLPHAAFSVKTGSQLHFHHGARELVGHCTLRGRKLLAPGESCSARFRFPFPLAARKDDPFVVRFFSPVSTVGGGSLTSLDPVSPQEATLEGLVTDVTALDITALLAEYHKKYPLRDGMKREDLLQRLKSGPELLDELAEQNVIKLRGGVAALPEFQPKYTPELAKLRDQIEVAYRRAKLELLENEKVDPHFSGEVMYRLLRDNVILPLGLNHRIHYFYLSRAEDALRHLFRQDGTITLSAYRDALGTSRKNALLLLEYFDRTGLTQKEGDSRTLRMEQLVDSPLHQRKTPKAQQSSLLEDQHSGGTHKIPRLRGFD